MASFMVAPDSLNRVDQATDLAIPIIARDGLLAVTPRAIAEGALVSRQAVHQWLGGQEQLRLRVAERFTARWTHWATFRFARFGTDGLLPGCAETRAWTRVWAALLEAAGRNPEVGDLVRLIRREEGEMVLAAIRDGLSPEVRAAASPLPRLADPAHALVEGLRLRLLHGDLLHGDHLLPVVAARRLVRDAVATTTEGYARACLTSSKRRNGCPAV